jgi:hypothetical protein
MPTPMPADEGSLTKALVAILAGSQENGGRKTVEPESSYTIRMSSLPLASAM